MVGTKPMGVETFRRAVAKSGVFSKTCISEVAGVRGIIGSRSALPRWIRPWGRNDPQWEMNLP